MFIMALMMFLKIQTHFVSLLLTIEFLVLIIYLSLSLFTLFMINDSFCSFYFISVAVCEGALGLSLVVTFVRTKGNDLMSMK